MNLSLSHFSITVTVGVDFSSVLTGDTGADTGADTAILGNCGKESFSKFVKLFDCMI